ncbi:MAG: twitching motility protein PilT, partial [Akkermansiaceae bacterium]|nr:twitching motility protein PilT [Akkermansiaceae bacterium]
MEPTPQNCATFRFYGDLEVFLPPCAHERERRYLFSGNPSV